MTTSFNKESLKQLAQLEPSKNKSENGSLVIIAGSDLFHGPALVALRIATRIVGMVYFTSPEDQLKEFAMHLKSEIASFIWIPIDEANAYIKKSDAVLIGPGLKRYRSENAPPSEHNSHPDEDGAQTKQLTEKLLEDNPKKQWVIDAGSLQTIAPQTIPSNAIITPNTKEFSMLFQKPIANVSAEDRSSIVTQTAQNHNCIIVSKGNPTIVSDGKQTTHIPGGPPGLSKGSTGDCLAAITASLACKNSAYFAACAGDFIVKETARNLYQHVGPYFSGDDISKLIPTTLHKLTS